MIAASLFGGRLSAGQFGIIVNFTAPDEGTVDLALGACADVPPCLTSRTLYRTDLVWIASAGNPLGVRRFTAADLLDTPHLVIATRRAFEPVGALLAGRSLEKRAPERPDDTGAPTAGAVPATVYDGLTAAVVASAT